MAWFLRGMLKVGGVVLMMLAKDVSPSALLQGKVLRQQNVLMFPVGGVVDSQAPVVISWIPSTPGPITIKLHQGFQTREVAAGVKNTGFFVWPVPSDLNLPKGSKYHLQITDDLTKESSSSGSFELSRRPESSTPEPTPQSTKKPIFVVTITSTSTTRPPSITDTTLLLDLSSAPTEKPTIALPPLITPGPVIGEKAPNVGIITGVTVGACVAAGLILVGSIVVWRRKRGGQRFEEMHHEHEQNELERQTAIETYGRTGGMVNAF